MYFVCSVDYGFAMTQPPPNSRPKAYSYLRMSTERQLLGDSKRRQEELSRSYAKENGLDLVDDNMLEDIGVSAFKGRNLTKGALGVFFEQVKSGKIEKGCYLLVESLDRLDRRELLLALRQFMDLITAGITVVTLMDGQKYEADTTGMVKLIYSITVMERAHEESRTKSERIARAWANKRKMIGDRKLTARSVGWVELSADRKNFAVIPERVAVVRRIFEETADGIGAFTIVRRLNQQGIRPFGHAATWQKSSLDKIILSRAVIGEFQPKRRGENGMEPVGDPIAGYYPPIIDEDLFYRAQAARASRRHGSGGRRGERISNLFSGLAVCGYCGARMHYLNKGAPPKGGSYLVCDAANRKAGCTIALWNYSDFETSFLTFVEELDLEPLAQDEGDAAKRAALDASIQNLQGRRNELIIKRDRTYETNVSAGGNLAYLADKMKELSSTIAEIDSELEALAAARRNMQDEAGRFYESRDQIKGLIAKLQSTGGDDVYKLRAQVAARLKSLTSSVQVFAEGKIPEIRKVISFLEAVDDPIQVQDVMETFTSEIVDPASHRPYFVIMTKDRRIRRVTPSQDNPTKVHEQVISNSEGTRILNANLDTVYERVHGKKAIVRELSEMLERSNSRVWED